MSKDYQPDNPIESYVNDFHVNDNLNLTKGLRDLEYKFNSKRKINEQFIIIHQSQECRIRTIRQIHFNSCDNSFKTLNPQKLFKQINPILGQQQFYEILLYQF